MLQVFTDGSSDLSWVKHQPYSWPTQSQVISLVKGAPVYWPKNYQGDSLRIDRLIALLRCILPTAKVLKTLDILNDCFWVDDLKEICGAVILGDSKTFSLDFPSGLPVAGVESYVCLYHSGLSFFGMGGRGPAGAGPGE